MYEDFYRLKGKPFQLTPDPRFYFDSRTHRKAMAYLSYGLSQGEGFIIITGDVGAGKTTLVGHLFEELDKTRYVLAKVVTTQLDADNTLKMVANGFGIKTDDVDKADILTRIELFLRRHNQEQRRTLLIVDEAQNLPVSALEELRMLSNFTDNHKSLLQIFLLGQPEFREKLAMSSELEQLRQRVIATHHLDPMQKEEVPDYIMHRLKLCGWRGQPSFTDGAFEMMYDYSGGVPRRLNTLVSRILLFGALEEKNTIDEDLVGEVLSDLKKDHTPTTPQKPTDHTVGHLSTAVKANVPPKIKAELSAAAQQYGALEDPDSLIRRVETLERYVKTHDQTIRQTLKILSDWADVATEPMLAKTGTDET